MPRRAKPKKPQYPPQGGEARICFTLFVAMLLAVLSAVTMIYSSVLVYFPSKRALESDFQGPRTCTTVLTQRRIHSQQECDGWSSCEEWCLGKAVDACGHVWAKVREEGAEVRLEGCRELVDHTCATLKDLPDINCKGNASECASFDDVLLSCTAGICRNVSQIYQCEHESALELIQAQNDGLGFCGCAVCTAAAAAASAAASAASASAAAAGSEARRGGSRSTKVVNTCPVETESCLAMVNKAEAEKCLEPATCSSCWQVCHGRLQCFDLRTRADPTNLGKDDYQRPSRKYYRCSGGKCSEVHDLKCQRRCESVLVDTAEAGPTIVLSGERLLAVRCSSIHASNARVQPKGTLLVMACTEVSHSPEEGWVAGKDCVNGTWMESLGLTNYSTLTEAYFARQDATEESAIPSESALTLNNMTQLRVNMEGCVNTLRGDCAAFYAAYGRDGRNSTSRSIFRCFVDPSDPSFAIIDFDRAQTRRTLLLCLLVPAAVLAGACSYICACQRAVHVARDGRMRLRCCGRYVSGIGGVNARSWQDLPGLGGAQSASEVGDGDDGEHGADVVAAGDDPRLR